jgi:hypothetical protein
MMPEAHWTAVDAVTIALAAATVVLAGVGVGAAFVAWWGYRDIKAATMASARETLAQAEADARKIAEQVAASEIRAYLDGLNTPQPSGAEDISTSYQEPPL